MKPSGMLLATAQVPPFRQGFWGHTSRKVSQWRPEERKERAVLKGRTTNSEALTTTLQGQEPVSDATKRQARPLTSLQDCKRTFSGPQRKGSISGQTSPSTVLPK